MATDAQWFRYLEHGELEEEEVVDGCEECGNTLFWCECEEEE